MDDLSALAPQMAAGASPEVFHQLGIITRQLHDTLTQLGVMPKLQLAADGLPDARSRLNYIASKTSDAANKVLNSVDQAKADHAHIASETRRIAQAVSALAQRVQEITRSQEAIGEVTQASLSAVDRAREAVEGVGQEVSLIVSTLRQVADAAGGITQIALQTRLVAFNASVEAKRAGEAGRGFGVVADAVKDLAAKVEASSKQIMSTVAELNARIESLATEIRTEADAAQQGAFHRALADVQDGVGRISEAAGGSRAICADLGERMVSIEGEMRGTGAALDAAMTRSESFLRISEQLIETVAQYGIQTEDTPYIQAARQAAARISQLLEGALRTGNATMADLFDEAYSPVPGSNPLQHTTRFCALADRLFPQVQEQALAISPKVVYCIAVDRNGCVPTHNQKYCQPQRAGDVVWNTANSRWRRIFNDRTGLASARNERPFLLQTYRRDMGGGHFSLMKEAAAPIVVGGRHWGGLRLAFQF
ncbi:protein phosphatase CheZ [uncultured Piscinibacter sp.]|uniref:protein phosphatase CheZ n=1 Tax=uncultured Piscinibacter sp. TaxID=1131835 RepID=UPI0026366672|nr:protein phosphatase CheZ [uncultured Piscinibacter sp.]